VTDASAFARLPISSLVPAAHAVATPADPSAAGMGFVPGQAFAAPMQAAPNMAPPMAPPAASLVLAEATQQGVAGMAMLSGSILVRDGAAPLGQQYQQLQ
jgi:hypothetical protein